MDLNSSNLLDALFEGQEELVLNGSFAAADPKPNFLLQDHPYVCISDKACETWTSGGAQGLNDDDPEELFQLLINPNDIYDSSSAVASPESDSGISDDPCVDTPLQNEPSPPAASPPVIYEVICDTGMVEGTGLPDHVFSSAQGNWAPPGIVPEACAASRVSLHLFENAAQADPPGIAREQGTPEQLSLPPGLCLTDEERRLLSREGVSLQNNSPLTKAEERILKKVRRKIRNKQSAQDSRRRKKEYIDSLENRVTACSAQNQELRRKVQELQIHNVSLLDQLRTLQGLIKRTSTKAAQTTACLMILIFSLGLLILPSYSSLLSGTQLSRDGYKPSRVISRHILTQGGLSGPEELPAAADPELPRVQVELMPEDPDTRGAPLDPAGKPTTNASDPEPPRISQEEPKQGLVAKSTRPEPDKDPGKPMHMDEM
ncbi:Cyclic AMP-responsive element-binding protein 3-like protein 4 [Varanus komodoensis]|uniref:cyclic AMP-responsive element-binding protein 3-like protein 4 n=1 Tax=Varanus komodoensis TaxID=61221 RepID=UPI001CF79917|nr:cyclic AMP-responsive element-binding protein 3-like protein 4 [Varanus komodoensis]KAF7238534.1 Cyclic AMP-responsive element-binding protein 3-like protein 4 [Varanus komodoensis]